MAKGNPNPSPATRFGGKNANPSGRGKTKEQARLDVETAENAAKIRNKLISEVLEKVQDGGTAALEFIDASVLKLISDSENRAFGLPKQSVDVESPNGTMTPQPVDAALAASLAKKLTE